MYEDVVTQIHWLTNGGELGACPPVTHHLRQSQTVTVRLRRNTAWPASTEAAQGLIGGLGQVLPPSKKPNLKQYSCIVTVTQQPPEIQAIA